jgi:branched-subunit amino acid aminotransferase/4-amino-4-deoxychorismate lyase
MNQSSSDGGTELFETILVRQAKPVLALKHFERMRLSARQLGLPEPARDQFVDELHRATLNVKSPEGAARARWSGTTPNNWRLQVTIGAIPEVTRSRREKGRVMLLGPAFRRELPQHKIAGHYAVCRRALQNAVANGFDEALFVSASEEVLEGTATNVFAVDGDRLTTPPLSAGILPGIMRAWVIDRASEAGMTVKEGRVEARQLRAGSFLTSSLTTIAAIRLVDDSPAAPVDRVVETLQALFARAW